MHGKNVFAAVVVFVCAGLPSAAIAQSDGSAGVVTTVTGDASLFRAVAAAQPVSLRMRDEIFVRDRIHTQERSLVRVLLGGKALITVRELSELTVTEETGRVTVDLQSGKIGVAVVKGRMRPGEVIEIRSPNATAAVRGTVFVVEVAPLKAGASTTTTQVHLFHGALDVTARLDPSRSTVRLAEMQSVAITGNSLGSVRPLSRADVAALTADLRPPEVHEAEAPSAITDGLVAREQARAVALASALLAPSAGGPARGLKNLKGTVNGAAGAAASVTDASTEVLDQLIDTLYLEGLDQTLTGVGNTVGSLGGVVGGLGGTIGNVGGTLGGAVGAVGSTVGGIGGAVGGLGLGGSVSGLGGTVGGLGGTVGGAVGGVGGAVGGLGGAVGGTVGGVGGAVGGVVGGVGGAVGGAVSGTGGGGLSGLLGR
ncbi:MAG TPA: FecR domain-containing protein [Methylomirabilota bacterium]|nr:FecR domain-containing protein [Methylomirabilota bacterium]